MSREVSLKEINSESHRKVNEGNCKSSANSLLQVYNHQEIRAFDANIQGFQRFFESMLEKMLKKNPDGDVEQNIIQIFDQWANLTEEQQHFITCISLIHNQENCGVPLPEDLDIHKLKLLTFNVLEGLVESLLENYENSPNKFSSSFELPPSNTTEMELNPKYHETVPYSDITEDMIIKIDFHVNMLEAYHASKLLLNLDENALLE